MLEILKLENLEKALLPLFEKYQIPIPVDDWENRIQPPDSVLSACQTGVEAKIENGEMYERLLALTSEFPDVQTEGVIPPSPPYLRGESG